MTRMPTWMLLPLLSLAILAGGASAANLTVNGSQTHQTIDGYGVNINAGWWNNGEVTPALDLLVDQLGARLFRAVIEEMDWEAVNDNADPAVFNWAYYNAVYSNARFQGVWSTLRYLNQKSITDGLVISFMGQPPSWMGPNSTVSPANEDEFVEAMASLLYYARHTAGVQFTLVSPLNETDTGGIEGPNMGAAQMARVLQKLAVKLDAIGMSDIRFIAPEAASDWSSQFNALVANPVVRARLAFWGVHKYDGNAGGFQDDINASVDPAKKFWVTETATFSNTLSHIPSNPTAGLVWDGFDSVYQHAIRAGRGSEPPNDSPGIEPPLIAYNATTHLYTPRKGLYEHAQLFKFVSPGAVRIGAADNDANLTAYAFRQPGTARITIVGRNSGGSAVTVDGTLSNLPAAVGSLEFYRTNSSLDLARGGDVAVSNNTFSVSIPADTYFTLVSPAPTFLGTEVKVDAQGKLVPWFAPATNAYHEFLVRRWNFVRSAPASPGPAPRSNYPQYYFYNGYNTQNTGSVSADTWMNDVGEKLNNWFESARLYYAYTGDTSVMDIARGFVDYCIDHGTSPANFAWPNFPFTTTNAGDTEFRGFTSAGAFALYEVQVDHAGDSGLAYYRMWQFYDDQKYLSAAINVADVLAAHVRTGDATHSVWPYRVNLQTGAITSEYGANWISCYALLDELIKANIGTAPQIAAYTNARDKARAWMLAHPVVTGYWTDGHSDNPVNSSTYKSNMSKSNYALYALEHPAFDPDWLTNIPRFITWTEDYFVTRTSGEPATFYGANVVGEQDGFNYKMDYQTARYAAECARWYRVSGDEAYREKAYRALNFVTYCSDLNGRATESPFSLGIATWWSDCYGEGPRMFYEAFAAMPEWAPLRQNHILYSYEILTNVSYAPFEVAYDVGAAIGVEYFRLAYQPTDVTVDGVNVPLTTNPALPGWTSRPLGGGDYAIALRRNAGGHVRLFSTAENNPPTCALTSPSNNAGVATGANLLLTAAAVDSNGSVARVEFFNGAVKLGEDTTAPYHFAWNHVPAGSHNLTAVATDNQNAQATSAPVTLTVGTARAVAFGSIDEGNTQDTMTDNTGAYINAGRFLCTSTMPINAIRAKVGTITGSYQCAVYEDFNENARNKLAESATLTNVAAGWRDFPLTSTLNVTAGTHYWLAIWSNDVNARIHAINSGLIRYAAYPFGPWPNPVNLSGVGNFTYSIHATGTAPTNVAPTCNAGPPQVISLPATATLNGTAGDDGQPSAALTTSWVVESGPGPVTFANATALNTTATFGQPGKYTLRLLAHDGAVTTGNDVLITVRDSFAAWAARNGVGADTGDVDRDGLSHLFEYAFATNPAAPSATPVSTQLAGGRLQIHFPRDPALTDLTYTVQASDDLASWTPIARSTAGSFTLNLAAFSVTESPNGSLLEVIVTDDSLTDPRFLRLKVSCP